LCKNEAVVTASLLWKAVVTCEAVVTASVLWKAVVTATSKTNKRLSPPPD
jgi:hypothetical protein